MLAKSACAFHIPRGETSCQWPSPESDRPRPGTDCVVPPFHGSGLQFFPTIARSICRPCSPPADVKDFLMRTTGATLCAPDGFQVESHSGGIRRLPSQQARFRHFATIAGCNGPSHTSNGGLANGNRRFMAEEGGRLLGKGTCDQRSATCQAPPRAGPQLSEEGRGN